MITTNQQTSQFNFPAISGLADNGKFLLSFASIQNQKRISSRLEAVFSDFPYNFKFEIVRISQSFESNNIIFYLQLSKNLIIKTTFSGYWTEEDDPKFYLQQFNIEVEERDETAISAFLLSSFWAMLCLSKTVKFSIPDLDYSFTNSFDLSLNEISVFLQERQIAYRLMVIEKAFGISLSFPDGFIDGSDIENIAFCYHAIVKREFDWFCNTLTFFPPSTTGFLDLLPPTNSTFPLVFPTTNEKRVVFGEQLNLGQFFIEINDAVVVNYEEAKKNLSVLNGEPVEVLIKSVSGKMKFKSINVPTLPKNSFSKDIQKLVDLEEKLDSRYFDKYLNSFSNAFEDLTDEQIQAITERPALEEEAFSF